MKKMLLAAVAAIMVLSGVRAALAQGSYLECTACQLVLGLVDASAGNGQDVVVDASKQCALLPPGDREACVKFYATTGPKFIKILKARRAKGESLEDICRAMDYCPR